MTILELVWRNVLRGWKSRALAATGVAVGVGAAVALGGISRGFEKGVSAHYAARGTDAVVASSSGVSPLPMPFDSHRLAELTELPGIEVTGSAWDLVSFGNRISLIVFGWEPDSFLWEHLQVLDGSLNPADGDRRVFLGKICAGILGKGVGDTLRIGERDFQVAGIFRSDSFFENGGAIVLLSQFQETLGNPGEIRHANIRFLTDEREETEEKLQALVSRSPGLRMLRTEKVARHNIGVVLARAMSLATGAIAIAVAVLGVTNTAMVSVLERRAEIGTLMALGWRRRRVFGLILWESLAVGLAGAVFGQLAGIGVVAILLRMEALQGKIYADFGGWLLPAATVLALLAGLLGGIGPACRAALLPPARAMREE